jgi:arsenate reductase (glutaredoxin)
MGLQVFGTKKCPETRNAERFLKERGVAYQFVDLAEKGISPGELRSISGDAASLIDSEGGRYREKGLRYMDYDAEEEILKDPLLLKTPILRDGRRALIGFSPEAWRDMLCKA